MSTVNNVKHHVNPETGKTGVCRAVKRPCKFGLDNHYDTVKEAEEAAAKLEAEKTASVLQGLTKSTSSQSEDSSTVVIIDSAENIPLMDTPMLRRRFAAEKSHILCPECAEPVSNASVSCITDYWNQTQCKKCGEVFNLDQSIVNITPEYNDVEADPRAALSRRWTHMTVEGEKWYEQVCAVEGLNIHAGDPQAASDRMISNHYHMPDSAVIHVFAVEFKEPDKLKVVEEIAEDDNSSILEETEGYDVAVYANRWENPGSLSVEADPKTLRVAEYTTITLGELRQRRSVYNIPDKISEKELYVAEPEPYRVERVIA